MKFLLAVAALTIVTVSGVLGDCKGRGESCNPVSRCCDKMNCQYEEGFNVLNPIKDGQCVQCIDKGRPCIFDVQCCGAEILCQKNTPVSVNGVCSPLHSRGQKCYKDSQCASRNCEKTRIWKLYGKCA